MIEFDKHMEDGEDGVSWNRISINKSVANVFSEPDAAIPSLSYVDLGILWYVIWAVSLSSIVLVMPWLI